MPENSEKNLFKYPTATYNVFQLLVLCGNNSAIVQLYGLKNN